MIGRRGALAGGLSLVMVASAMALVAGTSGPTFSPGRSYAGLGRATFWVAVGDFNRDRRRDVVVGGFRPHRLSKPTFGTGVLFGLGRGRLSRPRDLHFAGTHGGAVADFNQDGNADVLRLSHASMFERPAKSAVLFGNGRGGFPERSTFVLPVSRDDNLGTPAIGDFDRDGMPDLVVTESGNFRPGVWVLPGDGTGRFSAGRKYRTAAAYVGQAAVADFNRDRNPDLAVPLARDEISVPDGPGGLLLLFGDGSGGFPETRTYHPGDALGSIAAGDFNGDRNPDLAAVNADPYLFEPADVRVLLGDGNGGFSPATRYRAGPRIELVVVADFDRDGNSDLAVASDQRVWVLRGNGTGGFRPAKKVADTDCCGVGLITADLNRDARTDMIHPNKRKGVSVLLNTSIRRVRR